jgi:hypothetical protein
MARVGRVHYVRRRQPTLNVYYIHRFNPQGQAGNEKNPLYFHEGYWKGKTAKDALARFAEANGLMTGSGEYFYIGRNRLGSYGKNQYKALKTGIVPPEEAK